MLFDHMHPVLVVQRHMYGDTWHTAGVAVHVPLHAFCNFRRAYTAVRHVQNTVLY
ncbi:hypothetical protein J2777_002465 [Paraburkholderia graminis]|nr:hypothetical protein [Paraburkholderia graminis]